MPVNEHTRSKGNFKPAPEKECDQKTWYANVNDMLGHPIQNVRQRHTVWRQGGEIQKFHMSLEVQQDDGTLQAPEVDCNHSMCHIHPNGHHPPSGKPEPLLKILDLDTIEDVRKARNISSEILESTILLVLLKENGVWNERTVKRSAIESASGTQNETR